MKKAMANIKREDKKSQWLEKLSKFSFLKTKSE